MSDTLTSTAADLRSPRRLLARYRPRRPRYTIRLRLAVLYSGVFLILGTLLVALIFLSVRHSTHGAVVSVQGTVTKLAEREHGEGAHPGSTLSVLPERLVGQEQAHKLSAVAVNVNSSDLHQLLIWSVFALAIMAVASVAIGWVLAGRVLRPLQVITTAARAPTSGSSDALPVYSVALHSSREVSGPELTVFARQDGTTQIGPNNRFRYIVFTSMKCRGESVAYSS